MAILVCENLNYLYNVGTPFETAAIGIIGHTGSGKSTLIQHFNGLLEPTSGKIFVNSNDIWSKENRKQIRNVRFAVGLCFQYPEYQIFEETIFKEIAYGPTQMGLADDEIKKRVYESMDFVGISRELESKSPFDLSGGQKRRVAIASIIARSRLSAKRGQHRYFCFSLNGRCCRRCRQGACFKQGQNRYGRLGQRRLFPRKRVKRNRA